MKRRDFIKKAGVAAAAGFAVPYILPSGRIFAASGARIANHVVFCLFAGGVRNFESVQKAEGNLMRNILSGTEPISPDILGGMDPLPTPTQPALQTLGTLYKNFRYASGPTGHFNGHTCAVTGKYTEVDLNVRDHPEFPTVFEYYRKHNSPQQSAMNCWWVSNALGPFPALNFSKYSGYGSAYGANFIAPTSLISLQGYDALGNMKNFSSQEKAGISKTRSYLDNIFSNQFTEGDAGVTNTSTDTETLQGFITDLFNKAISGQFNNPWGLASPNIMNNDMYNIVFAEEIIKEYQPELLVVNMQDVDVCHANFTQYCNNLRKADYAVRHLWDTIQATPGMTNDTIMIVVPEHGRNLNPNTVIDAFGRYAVDHTSDQTSREIFCLVLGPPGKVVQNQVISTVTGESIDVIPTIAKILGFDSDIPEGMLNGQPLNQALV